MPPNPKAPIVPVAATPAHSQWNTQLCQKSQDVKTFEQCMKQLPKTSKQQLLE